MAKVTSEHVALTTLLDEGWLFHTIFGSLQRQELTVDRCVYCDG